MMHSSSSQFGLRSVSEYICVTCSSMPELKAIMHVYSIINIENVIAVICIKVLNACVKHALFVIIKTEFLKSSDIDSNQMIVSVNVSGGLDDNK